MSSFAAFSTPSTLRRTTLALACASSLAFAVGCGDSGSGGSGGDGGSGASGAEGGSGGQGGVGGGSSCLKGICVVVPDGWLGPLQLETDEFDPTCGEDYPITNLVGFVGEILEAEEAECTCSCGEAAGATCEGDLTLTGHDAAACGGDACVGEETLEAGACVPVSQGACALSKDIVAPAPDLAAASCAPEATTVVAPAKWTERARICGIDPPAKCGDGVCVADDTVCVAQEGDVECPEGFEEKTLVYGGADDTRGCSECTCGAVTGTTCEGTMTSHGSSACNTALATADVPGCVSWLPTAGTTHVQFELEAAGGSCEAAGGEPTGTAVPSGVRTVCCTD